MKDRNIYCFNKISPVGTDLFREGYSLTEDLKSAHGVLVRSANLFETEFPDSLRAIARAGAGVNNIPIMGIGECRGSGYRKVRGKGQEAICRL